MKRNINSADRIIRVVIAAIIAVLFFSNIITGAPAIILMIAAGIILLTGVINFCPIYYLLGISTFRKKEAV